MKIKAQVCAGGELESGIWRLVVAGSVRAVLGASDRIADGANKGPNAHRVERRDTGVKPIFGPIFDDVGKRVPRRDGLTLEEEFRRLSDCRVLRRCGSAQPRVSGSRFRPAD